MKDGKIFCFLLFYLLLVLLRRNQGRTQGVGVGVKTTPLNLLCYKNVITYAKEFVYVFVHFLLV